ncbi:MAG: phosphatase PAP2 family protein [Pseudomonadota bacterium]|nr:phosphatase PAP2 family protein [Pseudomonadota bacterium]
MVTQLFFTPGVGFEAKGGKIERLIYRSVGFLLVLGNIILIVLLLSGRFAGRFWIRFTAKELAFLLLFLALGPGLIVNVLLKENWGRARPANVAQFGGTKEFTAAFIPSDQKGKSFSSGHTAASAYWIIAALLLAPPGAPRRIWILGVAGAYSLAVSWMRMAAGGHFLSDIMASYFIMAILALVLYEIVYKRGRSVI